MFGSNYTKSNRILKIKFKPSEDAVQLAAKIITSAPDGTSRQRLSTWLIAELCENARLPEAKVKISDTRQYHARRGARIVFRQYGYYRPQTKYIYIQNLTPARAQPLAPKTFLDTLLHEWMHHYDQFGLKVNSIHTSGFYKRLADLKQSLGV